MAKLPMADLPVVDARTGRISLEWYTALRQLTSEISAAGVLSFEGRSGAVSSANGDYTASEITNVPAGNISSVTVQAAIDEIDSSLGTISTQDANNVTITGGSITGITDLAVADGGTGGSTARAACANLGAWYVLGASAVAVSHTGNTTETTLATITVPANAMGANGILRITTLWRFSGTNSKTAFVRFNGTAGTTYVERAETTAVSQQFMTMIRNRNATNSQVGGPQGSGASFTSNSSANRTSAIDTTAAVDISIRGQLTNTGETIALDSYIVELYQGA